MHGLMVSKEVDIRLRLPEGLHRKLEAIANSQRRTLGNQIIFILEEVLK